MSRGIAHAERAAAKMSGTLVGGTSSSTYLLNLHPGKVGK